MLSTEGGGAERRVLLSDLDSHVFAVAEEESLTPSEGERYSDPPGLGS